MDSDGSKRLWPAERAHRNLSAAAKYPLIFAKVKVEVVLADDMVDKAVTVVVSAAKPANRRR